MISLKSCIVTATLITVALASRPLTKSLGDINEFIFKNDGIDYRLPNNTHPETYDLSLWSRIDRGEMDYRGLVKIEIVVDQPTQEIVLQHRRLSLNNITLSRLNGAIPVNVPILSYDYGIVHEFVVIITDGVALNVGDRLILEISYNGTLFSGIRGFFGYSYRNEKEEEM